MFCDLFLSQASFVSAKGEEDIDIDDPDFWQKWAKKADLDVDALMNKVQLTIRYVTIIYLFMQLFAKISP